MNKNDPTKLNALEVVGCVLLYILLFPFILLFLALMIVGGVIVVIVDLLVYPFSQLTLAVRERKREKERASKTVTPLVEEKVEVDDAGWQEVDKNG